jgi:hypothetical protein
VAECQSGDQTFDQHVEVCRSRKGIDPGKH